MTNGADAVADGMDVVSPSAPRKMGYDEINKTRDYITKRAKISDFEVVQDEVQNASSNGNTGGAGKLARFSAEGWLGVATPATPSHAVNKAYVDGNFAGKTGVPGYFQIGDYLYVDDEVAVGSHIIAPNLTAATSGQVIAYINGDGRLSKGTSSERYKHDIRDAGDLGDLFAAPLREYKLNDGDGSDRVGYIAEEVEAAGLARFVIYNSEGQVDSIDFLGLLMAQNAQLHARIAALEAERS